MADYYVDFTRGTNGTGTAAAPWNVFTSTQNAGVSAGDKVWFRRCTVAVNTKVIAFKAGTDNLNRITYIGWPLVGDEFYDSREPTLQAAWDVDGALWTMQSNNSTTVSVAAVDSNINIHRFDVYSEYAGNTTQTCFKMDGLSNITLNNCRSGMYAVPLNTSYTAGQFYINNSSNIKVNNSYINGQSQGNTVTSNREHTLTILNSDVVFTNCDFIHGSSAATVWTQNYMSAYRAGSFIQNSNISFYGCDWKDQFNMSMSVQVVTGPAHVYYFENSQVTISGCTYQSMNTVGLQSLVAYENGYGWLPFFRFMGALTNVNIASTDFSSITHKSNPLMVDENANLVMTNCTWDVLTGFTQNVLMGLYNVGTISIDGVTLTLPTATQENWNYYNWFAYIKDWEAITDSARCSFTNITGSGHLLDVSWEASDKLTLTLTPANSNIFGVGPLVVSHIANIIADDCSLNSFIFYNKIYVTNQVVPGGSAPTNTVRCNNCSFYNKPIVLHESYAAYIKATLYGCVGTGTNIIDVKTALAYTSDIKALRTRGFIGTGNLSATGENVLLQVLNSYNGGVSSYTNNIMSISSSSVARAGGAGYTNAISKLNANGVKLRYPAIGEDSIWVYFPTAGNYVVTAYMCYESISGAFIQGDIDLGLEIMDSYSYPFRGGTISEDVLSVWTGISGATNITVSDVVTIPKPQYCPIFLNIYPSLPGQIIYFDPKILITAV